MRMMEEVVTGLRGVDEGGNEEVRQEAYMKSSLAVR